MVDGFWEGGEGDGMDFAVDTEGAVTSKDAIPSGGGKSVTKEGKYHCMVLHVKKEQPEERKDWRPLTEQEKLDGKKEQNQFKSPSIQITFQVLQGDNEDQKDLHIFHRIYLWEWNPELGKFIVRSGAKLKFISQIAYGLGIIDKEQLDKQKFALNFGGLEGRQCVVEVRKKEKQAGADPNERDYFEIPWGNVWRPEDQPDVRKDAEAMALHVAGLNASDAGGSPNLF